MVNIPPEDKSLPDIDSTARINVRLAKRTLGSKLRTDQRWHRTNKIWKGRMGGKRTRRSTLTKTDRRGQDPVRALWGITGQKVSTARKQHEHPPNWWRNNAAVMSPCIYRSFKVCSP